MTHPGHPGWVSFFLCIALLWIGAARADTPAHAGSAACASCHPDEGRRWQASHHARAMQPATPATVLGDFSGVRFEAHVRHVRFLRRGDAFFIHTEGPDGRPRDYPVSHTFGLHPLQQYLIPVGGGRLQAFDIAWDTRPKADGGQRWYALHPDEKARPGDPLHWTGRELNWNFMCAGCHSTGVERRYAPASGHYATTQAEHAVGCEACHGAGSAHAATPAAPLPVATGVLRRLGFAFDGEQPIARPRGSIAAGQRAGEICAGCHSRRQQLVADPRPEAPFLDNYRPALIEPGLYHPDGQIDDEVFEYGSFAQSAMHRAGVTCTHCHDPHDGKPRAPGNALCAQCHLPARYDAPTHHRHAPGSPGAGCVACHMPTKTYMGVHARHDHRLAVPDPAQSARLATPDACAACHAARPPGWAADALAGWRGRAAPPAPRAGILPALWRGGLPADGLERIFALDYAAILRASVLSALPGTATARYPAAHAAIARAARDSDGLARLGAARALGVLPPNGAAAVGEALLTDPLRAVRIEAARQLAGLPRTLLPDAPRRALDAASRELIAAENASAERPEAHVNLARFHAAGGNADAAEAALQDALRIDAGFVPALVNLADLRRAQGRDSDAGALLTRAVAIAPQAAEPRHALGLLKVRQGRRDAALPLLEAAARLAPGNSRYALVATVALLEVGRLDDASALLAISRARLPDDPELARLAATIAARRPGPPGAR